MTLRLFGIPRVLQPAAETYFPARPFVGFVPKWVTKTNWGVVI